MIARRYAVVPTAFADRIKPRLFWTKRGATNWASWSLASWTLVDIKARRRETGADL